MCVGNPRQGRGKSVFELRTAVAWKHWGAQEQLGYRGRSRASCGGEHEQLHRASCPVVTILEFLVILKQGGLFEILCWACSCHPSLQEDRRNRPITFSICPHHFHSFLSIHSIPFHSSFPFPSSSFHSFFPLLSTECMPTVCQVPFWTALSLIWDLCYLQTHCTCSVFMVDFSSWPVFSLLIFGKLCSWRRKRQPGPVFLPGKSHGAWSLGAPLGLQRVRHDRATEHRLY